MVQVTKTINFGNNGGSDNWDIEAGSYKIMQIIAKYTAEGAFNANTLDDGVRLEYNDKIRTLCIKKRSLGQKIVNSLLRDEEGNWLDEAPVTAVEKKLIFTLDVKDQPRAHYFKWEGGKIELKQDDMVTLFGAACTGLISEYTLQLLKVVSPPPGAKGIMIRDEAELLTKKNFTGRNGKIYMIWVFDTTGDDIIEVAYDRTTGERRGTWRDEELTQFQVNAAKWGRTAIVTTTYMFATFMPYDPNRNIAIEKATSESTRVITIEEW